MERRVLIDEFLEEIIVLSDYLDVKVHGAPPVHVLYQEVGLKEPGLDRVGGGVRINTVGLLIPPRPGDHPMRERESMAIRYARWEPPSFGYRLRNSSAQAHATDRSPYCTRR
jgi:hypothetical protein